MAVKLTLEKAIELYERDDRKILDVEVRKIKNGGSRSFIKYHCLRDGCGHIGWADICSIKIMKTCAKCSGFLNDINTIIEKSRNIHGDKYDYSMADYKTVDDDICIICPEHGSFYMTPYHHINRKQGCPFCSGQRVHYLTSVAYLRPDLIKYFKNAEDSLNYTTGSNAKVNIICDECGAIKSKKINKLVKHGFECEECLKTKNRFPESMKYLKYKEDGEIAGRSMKKVWCVCPDCKAEKQMTMSNLNAYKFNCSECSDGLPITEKFGIYLFKSLDIKIETRRNFKWAKNKYYDFYFKLNNEEYIAEAHGGHHYEECNNFLRTLKEEQANDELKYNLAIQNGIKPENYIVIDCRYSTFEWLKENYIKQLGSCFDLSDIDWKNIWLSCQKSILVEVCEQWELRDKSKDSTTTFANRFGLDNSTILKYLKIGNNIGICHYDGKDEIRKSSTRVCKNRGLPVVQYTIDGVYVGEYCSIQEARRQLNIGCIDISGACRGRVSHAGGYKWKYKPKL